MWSIQVIHVGLELGLRARAKFHSSVVVGSTVKAHWLKKRPQSLIFLDS